jgi:hypothetical protein
MGSALVKEPFVFVVVAIGGEYSDAYEYTVATYTDEGEAHSHARMLQEALAAAENDAKERDEYQATFEIPLDPVGWGAFGTRAGTEFHVALEIVTTSVKDFASQRQVALDRAVELGMFKPRPRAGGDAFYEYVPPENRGKEKS